jgi:hypothetical protein
MDQHVLVTVRGMGEHTGVVVAAQQGQPLDLVVQVAMEQCVLYGAQDVPIHLQVLQIQLYKDYKQ